MDNASLNTGELCLGNPALICRWRLCQGALPFLDRHMRGLEKRSVCATDGRELITPEFVAWAKQHIEAHLGSPNKTRELQEVLMLVVGELGAAVMSKGAYVSFEDTRKEALFARAKMSETERKRTGVAPEALFSETKEGLTVYTDSGSALSALVSLGVDLAATLGVSVNYEPLEKVPREPLALFSDEHGIVVSDSVTTADAPTLCVLSKKVEDFYAQYS